MRFLKRKNIAAQLLNYDEKVEKIRKILSCWKDRRLYNDYCDGGLKMIGLISFNKTLKTTWIKKYLDTTNKAYKQGF